MEFSRVGETPTVDETIRRDQVGNLRRSDINRSATRPEAVEELFGNIPREVAAVLVRDAESRPAKQLDLVVDRTFPCGIRARWFADASDELGELAQEPAYAARARSTHFPPLAVKMEIAGGISLIPVDDPDPFPVEVALVMDHQGLVGGHQYAEERACLRAGRRSGGKSVGVRDLDEACVGWNGMESWRNRPAVGMSR